MKSAVSALGLLISLSLTAPTWATEVGQPPFSCQYGTDNGKPAKAFERTQINVDDWYGPYNKILFCDRLDGSGTYVLVEEQLVKNFVVVNPPRAILMAIVSLQGIEIRIADDIDHLVFNVPADQKSLVVTGTRFGSPIAPTTLQLTFDAHAE